MIAIVDYGMGNLRSVQKAFERLNVEAQIVSDPDVASKADKIVLPGVGAIADAIAELERTGMDAVVRESISSGKPFLGVCLGFQALFESSEENGTTRCLGILPGRVVRFPAFPDLVVPHMGWNRLVFQKEVPIYQGLSEDDLVYFVHSYYAIAGEKSDVATTTDYGLDFCSSVARDNVFGVQFHPEKSQAVGLRILQNFADL
jgi:glutamine amidotransferase